MISNINVREIAAQCLREESSAITQIISQLDETFDQVVELLFHCRGKVIVTGVGKSGHVGAKIAATLSSTGTPAFYMNPLDAFHGDLGAMTSDDIVLAFSNSGQTSYCVLSRLCMTIISPLWVCQGIGIHCSPVIVITIFFFMSLMKPAL